MPHPSLTPSTPRPRHVRHSPTRDRGFQPIATITEARNIDHAALLRPRSSVDRPLSKRRSIELIEAHSPAPKRFRSPPDREWEGSHASDTAATADRIARQLLGVGDADATVTASTRLSAIPFGVEQSLKSLPGEQMTALVEKVARMTQPGDKATFRTVIAQIIASTKDSSGNTRYAVAAAICRAFDQISDLFKVCAMEAVAAALVENTHRAITNRPSDLELRDLLRPFGMLFSYPPNPLLRQVTPKTQQGFCEGIYGLAAHLSQSEHWAQTVDPDPLCNIVMVLRRAPGANQPHVRDMALNVARALVMKDGQFYRLRLLPITWLLQGLIGCRDETLRDAALQRIDEWLGRLNDRSTCPTIAPRAIMNFVRDMTVSYPTRAGASTLVRLSALLRDRFIDHVRPDDEWMRHTVARYLSQVFTFSENERDPSNEAALKPLITQLTAPAYRAKALSADALESLAVIANNYAIGAAFSEDPQTQERLLAAEATKLSIENRIPFCAFKHLATLFSHRYHSDHRMACALDSMCESLNRMLSDRDCVKAFRDIQPHGLAQMLEAFAPHVKHSESVNKAAYQTLLRITQSPHAPEQQPLTMLARWSACIVALGSHSAMRPFYRAISEKLDVRRHDLSDLTLQQAADIRAAAAMHVKSRDPRLTRLYQAASLPDGAPESSAEAMRGTRWDAQDTHRPPTPDLVPAPDAVAPPRTPPLETLTMPTADRKDVALIGMAVEEPQLSIIAPPARVPTPSPSPRITLEERMAAHRPLIALYLGHLDDADASIRNATFGALKVLIDDAYRHRGDVDNAPLHTCIDLLSAMSCDIAFNRTKLWVRIERNFAARIDTTDLDNVPSDLVDALSNALARFFTVPGLNRYRLRALDVLQQAMPLIVKAGPTGWQFLFKAIRGSVTPSSHRTGDGNPPSDALDALSRRGGDAFH